MTHHHTHRIMFTLAVMLGLTIGIISLAYATPGDLDTTFDTDCIVSKSLSGTPAFFNDIIAQPDNHILDVGSKD